MLKQPDDVDSKSPQLCTVALDARLLDFPGIGRVIYQTAVTLAAKAREDLSIALIGNSGQRNALQRIVAEGKQRLIDVHVMAAPPFSIREQFEMRQVVHARGIHVWHSPHFNVPLIAPCALVWSVNDLIPLEYPASNAHLLATIYCKSMYFCASYRATRILSISNATQTAMEEKYSRSRGKTETVYLGLDHYMPGIRPEEGAIDSQQQPEQYALYVGTHKYWKNLARLLDAIAIAKLRLPRIQLVLVGKQGKRKENLEGRVSELGLGENVVMLGEVDERTLDALYARANVVVCPSIAEGFGFSGLEAMRRGTPVIASDIPVFREVYQGGCEYFDPLRPESIAEALVRFLDGNVDRETLIAQGRDVASKYRWSDYAEKLVGVYRNVAGLEV